MRVSENKELKDKHQHDFIDTYLHYCKVSGQREACYLCEECRYAECAYCGAFTAEANDAS